MAEAALDNALLVGDAGAGDGEGQPELRVDWIVLQVPHQREPDQEDRRPTEPRRGEVVGGAGTVALAGVVDGVGTLAEGDANRDGRSEENGYGGETTSAAVRKNRDVEQDDGSIQMNGKLLEKGQRKSCPYVVEFLAAWEAFW